MLEDFFLISVNFFLVFEPPWWNLILWQTKKIYCWSFLLYLFLQDFLLFHPVCCFRINHLKAQFFWWFLSLHAQCGIIADKTWRKKRENWRKIWMKVCRYTQESNSKTAEKRTVLIVNDKTSSKAKNPLISREIIWTKLNKQEK